MKSAGEGVDAGGGDHVRESMLPVSAACVGTERRLQGKVPAADVRRSSVTFLISKQISRWFNLSGDRNLDENH